MSKAFNLSVGVQYWPEIDFMTQEFYQLDPSIRIFRSEPTIDEDGALRIDFQDSVSGNVNLQVYLEDNGGTERGGLNRSATHNFSLFLAPAYLQVRVDSARNDSAFTVIRDEIADLFGVDSAMIMCMSAPPAGSLFLVLGTVPTIVSLANRYNSSVLPAPILNGTGSIVDAKPFVRNFDSAPSFSMPPEVLLLGFAYNNFTLPGFISGVVSPQNCPLSETGVEVVAFDLTPLRFREGEGYDWVGYPGAGAQGPLATPPSISNANCSPACNGTASADLIVSKTPGWVGEVEFAVQMRGASASSTFVLKLALGLASPVLTLLENQDGPSGCGSTTSR